MKNLLSFPRVALAAVALGMAATPVLLADDASTTPTTTNTTDTTAGSEAGKHHHHHILTKAEMTQLKTARDAALAANPDLQTEETSLKQQFANLKSQHASKDQYKALHEQKQAFRLKLRDAELKVDSSLAPIFAKLDAARHGHHHST